MCTGDNDGDGYDDACTGLPLDDCPDARPIAEGTATFSTLGVTTDGPDHPGACDQAGYTHIESDIWFCYTATQNCDVTVSLCGSTYDTRMAVYDGCTCPVDAAGLIVCNDDTCDSQSAVNFAARLEQCTVTASPGS